MYGGYSENAVGKLVFIPQSLHFYVPHLKSDLDITQWIFYATRKDIVYMQVWRNINHLTYILLGQQKHFVREIGKQQVYSAEIIHVLTGDILGFFMPGTGIIPYQCRKKKECGNYVSLYTWKYVSDMHPGTTITLEQYKTGHGVRCQCQQYPIQAIVRGT